MFNFESFSIEAFGSKDSLIEFEKMLKYEHPENLCFERVFLEYSSILERKDGVYHQIYSGLAKYSASTAFRIHSANGISQVILDNPLIIIDEKATIQSCSALTRKIVEYEQNENSNSSESVELLDLSELEDSIFELASVERELASVERELHSLLFSEDNSSFFEDNFLKKKHQDLKIKKNLEELENKVYNFTNIVDISEELNIKLIVTDDYTEEESILIEKGFVLENRIRHSTEEEMREVGLSEELIIDIVKEKKDLGFL